MFEIEKGHPFQILYAGGETVRFAAEEFLRYLRQMAGDPGIGSICEIKIGEAFGTKRKRFNSERADIRTIYIGSGTEYLRAHGINPDKLVRDGFAVTETAYGLAIGGTEPRSALFGVYCALTGSGCRFIRAAGVTEFVPETGFRFSGEIYENPGFSSRGLTLCATAYNEEWQEEAIGFVDWCAKNFINTVFLHESVKTEITSYNLEVAGEIEKRGLAFEYGGHDAQHFLPRERFALEPERFVCKDGERRESGNICVSDPRNLDLIRDEAEAYARRNPSIGILHLWFEDTLAGSWCSCDCCNTLSASEQLALCVKAAAERLEEKGIPVKLDYLIYHDTTEGIGRIGEMPDNVVGLYCPRERCYAHAISDETCSLNRKYAGILQEAIALFGADRVEIFDYYMDFILFSKTKTSLPKVIAEDLKYYRSLGIERLSPLMFGSYSYWAYDLNLYVYAKHVFDPDRNADQTLREYLADFGFPEGFAEYSALLEEFTSLYYGFCGYPGGYYDIRGLELCEFFGEHVENIRKASKILDRAQEQLETLEFPQKLSGYFEAEKNILQITRLEVRGILERMSARFENYREKPEDKSKVQEKLERIKPILYELIEVIQRVPLSVKGVAGGAAFVDGLCKIQVWTLNELMKLELGLDVSLDKIE